MEKLRYLCTIGGKVAGAASAQNGTELPQDIKNRITI